MNRKASFNGLAEILMSLTEEEQLALVDSPDELKKFAGDLAVKIIQNTFFISLSDNEAALEFMGSALKWRRMAAELGYTGPVIWKVREGFTLKVHAPQAGPCYQNFQYLGDWELKNDEPTKNALAFWIPQLIPDSKYKNVEQQLELLAEWREKFQLPPDHLSSFGSAAILSGLILAYFKRKGDKVPLNKEWARTDTLRLGGDRLDLGGFDSSGLRCDDWRWDGVRGSSLGCFPLGVCPL
jgi:hypothetical protein